MLVSSLLVTGVEAPYGNVIDVAGNSTSQGAPLDAFTPKGGMTVQGTWNLAANQAWRIIADPAGSTHWVIENPASGMCIDIKDRVQTPGAVLHIWPVRSSNNANQLWDFVPDQFGSGAFFIQNPQTGLVIEIEGGSTQAGSRLTLGRRRLFDADYQLWTGVGSATGVPTLTLETPPAHFWGNGQYTFVAPDQTQPFTSLSVTIDVIEDLAIEAFTVQINGNAPAPPQNPRDPVSKTNDAGSTWTAQWLQYWLAFKDGALFVGNQFYHQGGPDPGNPLPSVGTNTALTDSSGGQFSFENSVIPQDTRIVLTLKFDSNDQERAIAISASVYQSGALVASGESKGPGKPTFSSQQVTEADLAPLGAFQVVVAGNPQAGSKNDFTTGMGTLTINCQPACTIGDSGGVDPLMGITTAESTNCYYGALPQGSFEQLVQPFGVTQPRIESVTNEQTIVRGAGMYPSSALTFGGHFVFEETRDSVPVDVVSGITAAPDGSFVVAIGCKWASDQQASANAYGAADASLELHVADHAGNSVQAMLATGLNPVVLSSQGAVGGYATAPHNLAVTPVAGAAGSASVSFTSPASDGGLPITGYRVMAHSSDGGTTVTATGSSSPITVSGLTANDQYTFQADAVNRFGAGQRSPATSPITI
jgi:Fibronectin type III domain/Ricin-type beta-trefoil lectin domain-like